jgi:hypothetical protein
MKMSRKDLWQVLACPPLAKGDKGGFLRQMFYDKKELMCLIHKISPCPLRVRASESRTSLLKRGIREKFILNT